MKIRYSIECIEEKASCVVKSVPAEAFSEIILPFLPPILSGISLLLVIIGWWIVSEQHNGRERRKELRELILDLKARINEILNKAFEYYELDGSNNKASILASELQMRVSALSSYLSVVEKAGLKCSCEKEMITFRQAVTGGDFATKDRKKVDQDIFRLIDLFNAGNALARKLDEIYFEEFKS